jgi:hypothetical protein
MCPVRDQLFASLCAILFLVSTGAAATATGIETPAHPVDSDHDGLSDQLEQDLLARFVPSFQVDPQDCAGRPAFFVPGSTSPIAASESGDGTIYGEATPRISSGTSASLVELRYFHLWRKDCGRLGHRLDAEHVSVLVREQSDGEGWQAVYWYAAAHEDTACNASQITRAKTLGAGQGGATVWISRGKHASFLNRDLCRRGCGGDDCRHMQALAISRIVNLGEAASPMNGAVWAASAEWPLAAKLTRSDFSPESVSRLEHLPDSDIAWVNPSKQPAQAAIAAGNSTADALDLSNRKTDTAISLAEDKTGDALETTQARVKRSLRSSARSVWSFLGGRTGKQQTAGSHDQAK